MLYNRQEKKKCFITVCLFILSLLSFNLPAAIWKVTDLAAKQEGIDISFYIHVQNPNGQTVQLDTTLLAGSGFSAEQIERAGQVEGAELVEDAGQIQIEQDQAGSPAIYRVSGGASLSRQAGASRGHSQELTRNLMPAFRVISTALQHPEFQRVADFQRQPYPRERRISLLMSSLGTSDLRSAMDKVSHIANELKRRGRIENWHPLMPYYNTEGEHVIELVLSPQPDPQRFENDEQFEQSIYDNFGVRSDNLPQLFPPVRCSSSSAPLPPVSFSESYGHQLVIRESGRTSHDFCSLQSQNRLSLPAPSLSNTTFFRAHNSENRSVARPPLFFLYRIEFPSRGSSATSTLPHTALQLAVNLSDRFGCAIWRYNYVDIQEVSQGRTQVTVLFQYYSDINSAIDLAKLWSSVRPRNCNSDIVHSLVHWRPMHFNSASLFSALEEERASRISSEPDSRQQPRRLAERLRQSLRQFFSNRASGEETSPMMGSGTEQSENRQPGTSGINTAAVALSMAVLSKEVGRQ